MKKDFSISIVDLDLVSVDYQVNRNLKEEKHDMNIDYTIDNDKKINFNIELIYEKEDIKVNCNFKFVIVISELDEIDKFIEENEKDILYPVYMKMSNVVSFLTDQSHLFPININPGIWIENEN
ncbi:hypothetical protein [Oceanobacillus neutriphilus]|uniref:Preprotein translocase subunit SecB n=1 Tax=Oceanobacillus neutriphilus TaxID=531815 RepID=A0ABQ2P3H7_9BACI|nr:hypothetical protein [Oceanobacillus neutriphilus]GGP17310.1 hypothetical protein GCM10011346_52650 [Oceanobacillus neutriphilus]